MISENIKHFRKASGMTQEEMAMRLHVVRQTVSKWEKGLSVPDAEVLVQMAHLLGVSVNQLLGMETDDHTTLDLAEELAKVNEQLAKKKQRERLVCQANKKRSLILYLSFFSLLIALIVKNETLSIILVGIFTLTTIAILYHNLALLTCITTDELKLNLLRTVTFFNIGVFTAGVLVAVLMSWDLLTFSENGEKLIATGLISCVIVFSGIISPRLPYNRHTGLRLPWTVYDEETWNVAHRTIGYISLPLVLLYLAAAFTVSNFEIVSLLIIFLWIGVPGFISFVFYWKKYNGKL